MDGVSGSLGDIAGRHREALSEARAGVAQMQRMLAYDPDANIEKRLLVLCGQEAAVLSQSGDVDEAAAASRPADACQMTRRAAAQWNAIATRGNLGERDVRQYCRQN